MWFSRWRDGVFTDARYVSLPLLIFLARASNEVRTDIPQAKEGVVIAKTTQAILIAHYGENVIAGNAATTVEQLADYLIKVGY